MEELGAFVPGPAVRIEGSGHGPLSGLALTVKDVIDVAGATTGGGNPQWALTHSPAPAHAAAVQRLLDAGASVVGKSVCAELAFSLSGRNVHYGMPSNPAAPDRDPGGSTSGGASAVAGGAADLCIGTDTLGSIRVPASYCGLFGLRPTHGGIDATGAMPLAQEFDTVGLLARDATTLGEGGRVLVGASDGWHPRRVLVGDDAFAAVGPATTAALAAAVDAAIALLGEAVHQPLVPDDLGLDDCAAAFRDVQAHRAWHNYGTWIRSERPELGPDVADRFAYAASVGDDQAEAGRRVQRRVRDHLSRLLGDDAVALVPAAAGPAPLREASAEEVQVARVGAARVSCLASLAGLPAVVIPAAPGRALPVGLSIIGPAGTDPALLELLELPALRPSGPARQYPEPPE